MAGWAEVWRGRRLLSVAIAGLLWTTVSGPQAGADPPRVLNEVAAEQSEPDLADAAQSGDGDDRSDPGWHPSLDRQRPFEQRLGSLDKELAAGRFHAPLEHLQAVLNQTTDVFVSSGSHQPPQGARQIVEQRIQSLPRAGRTLYATLFDGEAERLLNSRSSGFNASDETLTLERVVQRYFYTPTGRRACRTLACLATDRGEWSRAAALWLKLAADPLGEPLSQSDRLRGGLCLRMAGQDHRLDEWLRPLGDKPVMGGSKASQWLTERAKELTRPARSHVSGPYASTALSRAATPPIAMHPAWTVPVSTAATKALPPILEASEAFHLSRAQPTATANFPLIVGPLLVFRDLEGIRAIDPQTRDVRWQYRAETGLRNLVSADTPEQSIDPSHVSRLWTVNQLQGLLSTDGSRVFAIDQLEWRWGSGNNPSGSEIDLIAAARQVNVLVALETQGPEAGTPQWRAGGPPNTKAPLAGHFILGPPRPLEGRLYVISEFKQEVRLSCLDARTGDVRWMQTLCLVHTPIAHDQQRYQLAAVPVLAEGLVLCPTHCGVLVAVDAQTGSLRWACSHDDPEQLERLATWPLATRSRCEHGAVVNAPVVAQDRLVYLPPQSQNLLCVDLATGKTLWTSHRDETEDSREYVAAVNDQTAVVVCRRRCRGLALATGKEIWSCPLASPPSGRGLLMRDVYLIPLTHGQFVCIHTATGRPCGLTRPNPSLRPGNLVVCGEMIVSQGVTEITAFLQAAPWLKAIETAARGDSRLLQAELKLALGDTSSAKSQLRTVVKETTGDDSRLAQSLLREVLFRDSWGDDALAAQSFAELDALTENPDDRARLLIRQATQRRKEGPTPAHLAVLARLIDVPLEQPLELDGGYGRKVAPEAWARGHVAAMLKEADAAERIAIGQFLEQRLMAAATSRDVARLQRWVRVASDVPQSGPYRLELARAFQLSGRPQAQELLLLATRGTGDDPTRAAATHALSELLMERGLPHDAARLLRELRENYGHVEVEPGLTGAELISQLAASDLSRQALDRLLPPVWLRQPGTLRFQIRGDASLTRQLRADSYPIHGRICSTPRGFPFQMFSREKTSGSELVLVDRIHGGMLPTTISLPSRYHYPVSPDLSYVGRLLPIGSQGMAHGISLLEQRMVWTTAPKGLQATNDTVRAGPAGPDYAIFQCWQHLFVLDPVDGHVLWHRTDVSGSGGLMADPHWGIIADGTFVTVFDADRTNYTVYDTVTGSELRRGRLEVNHDLTRRVFGRGFFHYTRGVENRQMRIWDVGNDRPLWQVSLASLQDSAPQAGFRAGAKLHTFVSESSEIAYVTTDGRVHVVDALTGETRLDAPTECDSLGDVGAIRVFSDESRYYVNLQRWPPSSNSNAFLATDTLVPSAHVQGDVLAYDKKTRKLVWDRDLGNRTVVLMPEFRLPLLISFCRVRNQSQMSLEVEVVDATTGDTLSRKGDLATDQILYTTYRRDPMQILLRGAKSAVTIDVLPPQLLQTAAEDGVQRQ